MKVKYLLFALLAAGAQPSLAAEPATGLGEIAIEPAAAITPARRQALQRVADALTAEASAKTGVNTRDAVEAIKALSRAAEPGGRLFRRKPTALRLAAVAGLHAAGPSGSAALKDLLGDDDRDVREVVEKALATLWE